MLREAAAFEPVAGAPDWLSATRCPACACRDARAVGALDLTAPRHGREVLHAPVDQLRLLRCPDCALVFKSLVPAPHYLASAFARQAGHVWTDHYDYADEAALVRELVGRDTFDLLDVGASGGGLLQALAGTGGRRSGLDVIEHPGSTERLRGELILGLVDDVALSWSEDPYDVVTMFDLLEHVYDVDQAFANVRRLVKPGGLVIAETGDVDSSWPRTFGAHRWWYASPVEHHVFWSAPSLQRAASRHGFAPVGLVRKRHKEQRLTLETGLLWRALKAGLYRTSPLAYAVIARLAGTSPQQPWSPFARDHIRVVLQRVSSGPNT